MELSEHFIDCIGRIRKSLFPSLAGDPKVAFTNKFRAIAVS
jgi:hypothetical protein